MSIPSAKRLLLTATSCCLALAAASPAQAQGGFGHFFAGSATGSLRHLENRLRQPDLLGSSFTLQQAGVMLGGGGFALLPNGLLLGGSGGGSSFGTSAGAVGEVELSAGGGFFNVGYAPLRKNGWLAYPYAGLGGMGAELKITNCSGHSLTIDADNLLEPGQTRKYEAGSFAFEAGLGMKHFFSAEGEHAHGFGLGLDAGVQLLPGADRWRYKGDDRVTTGLPQSPGTYYYIRLNLGGGGY